MGIEELIGFEDEIDELPPEAYEDYDNLADPLNLFKKAGRSDLPLGEERALTLTEQARSRPAPSPPSSAAALVLSSPLV